MISGGDAQKSVRRVLKTKILQMKKYGILGK